MSFTCLPTAAFTHFIRPASPWIDERNCATSAEMSIGGLASLRSMRSTIASRRSVSTGFMR